MDYKKLIRAAIGAKDLAYAPHSGFRVGAALLTEEGEIFTGCNVENAAFSPSVCAERTAVVKAISTLPEKSRNFKAIAVIGDKDDYLSPCGVCRQVLAEFCDLDKFIVIMAKSEDDYKEMKLSELLPASFGKDNLK